MPEQAPVLTIVSVALLWSKGAGQLVATDDSYWIPSVHTATQRQVASCQGLVLRLRSSSQVLKSYYTSMF